MFRKYVCIVKGVRELSQGFYSNPLCKFSCNLQIMNFIVTWNKRKCLCFQIPPKR